MLKKILGSLAGQLFIVLSILAVMSACSMGMSADTTKVHPNFEKTVWLLTQINGSSLPKTNQIPSLRFENGHITGYTGCNRLFANYTATSDGKLNIGSLGVTKMACMGEKGDLERAVLAALETAKIYALPPGQLNLLDSNHKVLLTYIPEEKK